MESNNCINRKGKQHWNKTKDVFDATCFGQVGDTCEYEKTTSCDRDFRLQCAYWINMNSSKNDSAFRC